MSTSAAGRAADLKAFSAFRGSALRKPPTKAHRPALWENMLGTVYACNAAGKVEYFDYAYHDAIQFIGPHRDVRVYRAQRDIGMADFYHDIRKGKLVWWVVTNPAV